MEESQSFQACDDSLLRTRHLLYFGQSRWGNLDSLSLLAAELASQACPVFALLSFFLCTTLVEIENCAPPLSHMMP